MVAWRTCGGNPTEPLQEHGDAIHFINLNCPLIGQSGDNCNLMEVKLGKRVKGSQVWQTSEWKLSLATKIMEAKLVKQVNGSQAWQAR